MLFKSLDLVNLAVSEIHIQVISFLHIFFLVLKHGEFFFQGRLELSKMTARVSLVFFVNSCDLSAMLSTVGKDSLEILENSSVNYRSAVGTMNSISVSRAKWLSYADLCPNIHSSTNQRGCPPDDISVGCVRTSSSSRQKTERGTVSSSTLWVWGCWATPQHSPRSPTLVFL